MQVLLRLACRLARRPLCLTSLLGCVYRQSPWPRADSLDAFQPRLHAIARDTAAQTTFYVLQVRASPRDDDDAGRELRKGLVLASAHAEVAIA